MAERAPNDVDDLARIYIRARINGRWDTFSLRELLTNGHAGQIGEWFLRTVLDSVGTSECAVITEETAKNMVSFIESCIRPVIRLKDDGDVDG